MPDTPDKPKPPAAGNPKGLTKTELRARFARSSVDREMAMMMFLRMKKPSIRGLHQELTNLGHKISENTIARWKREHHWTTHMDTHRKVQESEILGLINIMNIEGDKISDLAFKGAQARLIAHLGRAIGKVECKTPKDVNDLLEACEKLRAMSHSIRGDQFGEVRKTGEQLTGGPNVQLGSFKPKVVGGQTNGPANNGNGASHE